MTHINKLISSVHGLFEIQFESEILGKRLKQASLTIKI